MRFNKALFLDSDWRTASRQSSHLAPAALHTKEAVIQVYAARAFNWRGQFAVHTWLAVKAKDAEHYTVYQIIGWRAYSNLPVLAMEQDVPDRYWYGQKPTLLTDIRGKRAETLIPQVQMAVKSYPYGQRYRLWPGPNSNTFIAMIGRKVPELRLDLPNTAIGKDYLLPGEFFTRAPSGTGYQFSLYGLVGLIIARDEGIECNILGLDFGLNPWRGEIKLPGIGVMNLWKQA